MDSNRVMLKADARRRTVSCQPSPILAGVILFALGMLISTLTSYLMGMDRLATALTDAARFGTEAVEQAYLSFLEHYSVSGFAIALVVALRIMSYMVSVGFVIFTLHVSRDEKAEFGNLFDGFGLFFRVLWHSGGASDLPVEPAAGRAGHRGGIPLPAGAVSAARSPGKIRVAVSAREQRAHERA